MFKFMMLGLMAATALVPAAAVAQDRGDRPRREAREADRPAPQRAQRDGQRARPQPQRGVQSPQAPQRNYQNERRQRPEGADRARGDSSRRWQGGDRRPEVRGERPDVRRPDARPARPDRDQRDWNDRDRHPGERFDRDDRRPTRGYDRNDGWRNSQNDRDRNDRWRNPGRDRQDWNDRRGWNDRRNWSRGWRDDRRYDWNRYRQANRHVYRLPRYYPPSGYHYGYRRFSVGLTLGSMLYGSSYWINDPYSYRLPPAYGPFRWVRYYNDALLVDLDTGEVVDVVHDLFW